ncbi:MAG: polyprenyl synthetase family protein [Flavobacteriales bacterium]|jgi:geranylgeranyl diphosphate synthase type II|nr:polyprenyl synthetase family protein [Flavobacteriales bacterium]
MLEKYTQEINIQIDSYLKTLPDSGIYLPFKYIMNLGGKRFRPSLLLLATELFNGSTKEAINPAIGIEVFHNFSLVHDDIMDGAPLRRGKSPVHLKWDLNMGILSGDVMFAQANSLIADCYPHHLKQVVRLYNKTAVEVCEGQDLDMEFETRENVSIENYIKMIRLKTAVLVACALKIGAIIGDADSNDAALMYDFGINLGIAFQIHDDILDLYGDQKVFGKQIGGDIIEGKHSVLLITAKAQANKEQLANITELLNNLDLSNEEKVKQVSNIYNQLNVKSLSSILQNDYYNKALNAIQGLSISTKNKNILFSFAENLMKREV